MKTIQYYLNKKQTNRLLKTEPDELILRFYALLRDHEDRLKDLEKGLKT